MLQKPALREAGTLFRKCTPAWHDLGRSLLPDSIAPFKETRELMLRKSALFREQGTAATPQILVINQRLAAIRDGMADAFPLNAAGVRELREQVAQHIMALHDLEHAAVAALEGAIR